MNPNITKIIDQFLAGELSPEDTKHFEKRLVNNAELRQQVALQRDIIDGAKRAARRARVKQKAKNYHFKKLVRWSSLSVVVLAIATAATMYITSSVEDGNEPPEITSELKAELDKKSQIDDLKTQYFAIPKNGKVVLSEDGVLLSVPKKAFLLNGKPYTGQVVLQYQEAIKADDIVKAGLNTMSGDRLLETQGMFGVAGYTPEGEELEFNPKVGVYVQTPVDEYKEKMQLFDGVKNADGSIDWQNPEPLEKIPVPVDMRQLNFYPVGYEELLDKMKWKKNKESRDSLYLSFEEVTCGSDSGDEPAKLGIDESTGSVWPAMKLTVEECEYLYGDGRPIDNNMNWGEMLRLSEWKEGPRYELFKIYNRASVGTSPAEYTADSLELVHSDTTDASDYAVSEAATDGYPSSYILPSNVLGFWNKKFNNTNLATHEFEKRMRAIHATCDNAVLKKYTKQLNKSISKIDAEVAAMGHPEFKEFAAEHVGVVNPNNPHIKGLQEFYEKGIKKLKKRNSTLQNKEQNRRDKWDDSVEQERKKEVKRTSNRESKALKEEYDYNLDQVYKQLGRTQGFTLKHGGGTVKNVDAYVWEATVARKTTGITDPFTGKKAKITYNKFTMDVENPDKYIKLYAYLFPNNIKSYQRINGTNGKFDYPLNDFFIYDVCVVGITDQGYEYFQQMTLNSGELGTIKMEKITEAKLEANVKQLNSKRGGRPIEIGTELDWLFKEQANYKEQKKRKNMQEFRDKIQKQIFPCCPPGILYTEVKTPTVEPTSPPFGI